MQAALVTSDTYPRHIPRTTSYIRREERGIGGGDTDSRGRPGKFPWEITYAMRIDDATRQAKNGRPAYLVIYPREDRRAW